ncbi:DUF202 domain-containing protein [Dactylosporangium vinaceum]|uniref:DUF202 domain-containing protein n=1 Tax=Dactylosporangium vinaceum TaxID=53362 RepID=A0ABV5M6Z0_9ACTN|nr:DUF202 domain-containing protein [Dactylosporangium vinaceum]UAB97994.1 DUF202 domain-containing protein [Dactylosporangium vinaceum]
MKETQTERTQLSWRRTLISMTVVALLLARLSAVHLESMAAGLVVAATGLVWAGAVALSRHRTSRMTTPVGRELPALVGLILLYCAMGTLLLVS